MTKNIKTSGIVLKESNLGENGKLLVFFTKDFGKISVVAKGVKKTGSSLVQLSQLFAYSNLELYKGNSNLYTLTGGSLIESFSGLGEDYDRIASAGEIVLNILKVIQEDLPDIDSLRLLLNSLHFISSGKRSPDFVATIFLLKMLQFQGVVPEIYEIEQRWNQKLNDSTINALEHIFYSELSELFNFGVSDFVKLELKGVSKMLLSEIN